MRLAISTSSAYAVVALLDADFHLVSESSALSHRNASGVISASVLRLEQEGALRWNRLESLCVDAGPGSFSGVKVGAVMVKMWAEILNLPIFGYGAHDLYALDQVVAIEHRRNSFFVRVPNQRVESVEGEPVNADIVIRQGSDQPSPSFQYVHRLPVPPAYSSLTFVPHYGMEPSISLPKEPFATLPPTGGSA